MTESPDLPARAGSWCSRALLLVLLLPALLARAPALAAQTDEATHGVPWRLSYFPYIAGLANDGPAYFLRARYWQPAEYEARTTYTAAVDAAVGATFEGSRLALVRFRAPGLWRNWRLDAMVGAERLARYGYFGLGNDSDKNDALVTEETPFVYRVRRIRYEGRIEVTRRIRGPLHAALRGSLVDMRYTTLPGPSLFISDFGEGLEEDEISGRLALLYDTRNNEYNTTRGIYAEVGVLAGDAQESFSRTYGVVAGYYPIREGTVVAGRLGGAGSGGTATLYSRASVPTWDREVPVLGGENSHRAFDTGRYLGDGTLFANLEVRHDVLPFGDLGAVTVVGFLDAGRVFEEESFRLTTEDLHVGGGGGVAIRVLRTAIFIFNFAGGPDGFNFSFGNGWMF